MEPRLTTGPIRAMEILSIAIALLRDTHRRHGVVFNDRALRLTSDKLKKRYSSEGLGLLTKTLPSFGKHLDQVLAGADTLKPNQFGFKTRRGSKLPIFLGELFQCVLSSEGELLHNPDAGCVRSIRQILHAFGKYELPYRDSQEQEVLDQFERTEEELLPVCDLLFRQENLLDHDEYNTRCRHFRVPNDGSENSDKRNLVGVRPIVLDYQECDFKYLEVIKRARRALHELLSGLDFTDIHPRHGPGSVSTKERHSAKFEWRNVSSRITEIYPLDAYFYASGGDVCDNYKSFEKIGNLDIPARVLLVPKDSRGPRLISCEPVDKQWIQQGLARLLVDRIESHPLTRGRVNFTDQGINRALALSSSADQEYSTFDLKEASDRISTSLVQLLFPEHVLTYLECCRSLSTVLPSGKEISLNKFAPMGSALCFPVMALSIWALLYGLTYPDKDLRKKIFVYGDDVIVPRDVSPESVITLLAHFGLKINVAKSCSNGLFRESCGMDAFNGVDVTPVRFRTVWSKSPSPSSYASWIEYSNSLHHKNWTVTSRLITDCLTSLYGRVPSSDMSLTCPSLVNLTYCHGDFKSRFNSNLQKIEYLVPCLLPKQFRVQSSSWVPVRRFFSERSPLIKHSTSFQDALLYASSQDACSYTARKTIKLVMRWR